MEKNLLQEIKRMREIMNLNENENLLFEQPWLKNLFGIEGEDAARALGKDLKTGASEDLIQALKSGDENLIAAAKSRLFDDIAKKLASEGTDLKQNLEINPTTGKPQFNFQKMKATGAKGKIISALGVDSPQAYADFMVDFKNKNKSFFNQSAEDLGSGAGKTTTNGETVGNETNEFINQVDPKEFQDWADAIELRFGKNFGSDKLKRAAIDYASKLPGQTLDQKIKYLEENLSSLDAVFANRAANATGKRISYYQGIRTFIADLGSMMRQLPRNPKQFAGMAFRILSGFAVIGAVGGIIKPEEGHGRLYSAMNGVSFGLLGMFNDAPTKPSVTGAGSTPSQTSADNSATNTSTGTQTTNATPTQTKKLTWY